MHSIRGAWFRPAEFRNLWAPLTAVESSTELSDDFAGYEEDWLDLDMAMSLFLGLTNGEGAGSRRLRSLARQIKLDATTT